MQKKSYRLIFVLSFYFLFVFVLSSNSVWAFEKQGSGCFDGKIVSPFADCLQADVITVNHQGEDQEIAYYESPGDGPSVVLVHGNASSSWSYLLQLCGHLGNAYHLVAIDLPGHGRSSNALNSFETYNLIGYASILNQVVQTLDLEDAVFVGWSLGGHILLEAAPSLTSASGFMIFGTPPVGSFDDAMQAFNIENPAFFIGADPDWNNAELELYISSFFKPYVDFIPDFFYKDGRRADGIARQVFNDSLYLGLFTNEVEIVANLSVPIAIIHGAQDQFVHLDYIESLYIPTLWRGQIHVIQNAGHAPHWETPFKFNLLLSAFLRHLSH